MQLNHWREKEDSA